MPLTSNWNIWTPDDADNYDFIVDSAATAQTVDDALSDVAKGANRYIGTTSQMNSFAAPNGSEWFNTSDSVEYVRLGGSWVESHPAVAYSLISGALSSNSWTVLSGAGSWSAAGSTFTWSNGAVIPRTGVYEIAMGARVGTNISIFLGLKVNDTAASAAGVVALNSGAGFSFETGGSVSRSISLTAGDVITPAIYTSGTSGPYGLTPSGTFFSVTHIR